jgi:hypothetical protein
VDTQGLVLMAKVHRANVTDRNNGTKLLLEPARTGFLKRLCHLWLDAGYTGQEEGQGHRLGAEGLGMDRGDRAPPPTPRSRLPKR